MTSLADMTPEQRSEHMARIRGRDTRPEVIVRGILDAANVSHETHVDRLPGTPDIAVPFWKTTIFVHGCFWHQHGCRKEATKIRKNRAFWRKKFARNVERDKAATRALRSAGWRVLVVWECETRSLVSLIPRLLAKVAPSRRKCAHGPHVAEEGRSLCEPCSRYNRERIRFGESSVRRPRELDTELAARRAFLGLCTHCGLPAPDKRRRCYACGKKTASTYAWVERRHARGECRCGKPFAKGRKRCADCLKALRDAAKARYQKRSDKKQCVHCHLPAKKGHKLCNRHLKRLRSPRRRRRSSQVDPSSA